MYTPRNKQCAAVVKSQLSRPSWNYNALVILPLRRRKTRLERINPENGVYDKERVNRIFLPPRRIYGTGVELQSAVAN